MIDYKEKYEQAIERLKQWDREHPNGYAISERDEFVFPELKKSDGERIREYLITYFSDIDDCASSLKGKDVVAWLEKQKYEEWSFRPQSQWRPSDEQIEALEKILKYFHMMNARGETIDRLNELLEQLKRLKGE